MENGNIENIVMRVLILAGLLLIVVSLMGCQSAGLSPTQRQKWDYMVRFDGPSQIRGQFARRGQDHAVRPIRRAE